MKVLPLGVNGNISVNYVFTLLSLLEFNAPETILLALVGAVAQTVLNAKTRPRAIHLAFNLGCIAITVSAAAFIYHLPWFLSLGTRGQLLRLVLAGIGYFIVNTLTVSIVIALAERKNVHHVWAAFYNWLFAYYLVGVSLAEMVHLSVLQLGPAFTLALLPLVYIIYRSYRLYMEQLHQEKKHAENTASLHLRTIEALAMAIEAKDECTGEHLRRVQVYSLQVAERLNLGHEEKQALQAASILHDIGKLAVPDYIISKPGKLTHEEFEKMKVHTVVGAAILEQVAFPYAVPAIVRSHHERWDGTGYPDGLAGEQIPIGARILSAVDCFDALASDRQYRRALPLQQAMDYVVSLGGKSFDAKVVEILKDNYLEFERMAQSVPLRASRLDKSLVVSRGEGPDAGYEKSTAALSDALKNTPGDFMSSIASARHEVQIISELTHDLSGSLRLEETLSLFAERLKQLVPFDCIAVYIQEDGILKPKYVNGENSRVFSSLKIPVGQGLSGWVVETRKPILNGNPSVEPGYLNDPGKFSMLNSATSVPLEDGTGRLSGALTLYKAEPDAYGKEHLRILLAVSGKISRAIASALTFQQAQLKAITDELTDLPNARSLFPHLQTELVRCAAEHRPLTVMICDLDGFKEINDSFGHLIGNEVLKRVAALLRDNCRESDYVARMGGDEFVVLLGGADQNRCAEWMERMNRLVGQAGRELRTGAVVGMSVGIACYPEHGQDPESLIAHADNAMYARKRSRRATVGAVGPIGSANLLQTTPS